MKCDEAAEYVSALHDGVTIPHAAAVHIDSCQFCRGRLQEYVELGAELRRMSCLEISETSIPQLRPSSRGLSATFWQKSRKTMRIPTLAFASLIVAIVVLGSGWARQSVRASARGSVLLVQVTAGPGPVNFCALSSADREQNSCAQATSVESRWILWGVEVLSKDGDKALLGVRAGVRPSGVPVSTRQVADLPEQKYVLVPGETLNVNVAGFGTISLTGQWIDHIPAISVGQLGENHDLDPGPNELRFLSPLLLRGGQVVGDLDGVSTSLDQADKAVDLYLKGVGRFDLSLSSMPGAVEGKVEFNRVTFTLKGQSFVFVTGAPISRSHSVWILQNPNPPTWNVTGHSYLGTTEIGKLNSSAAIK